MLNGIVYTDREKCEACSACLRACRTKSIKIQDGKSEIIKESCLNCGACIKVCSKGAKKYKDSIENVRSIIAQQRTAIILAPSYVIVALKKYQCTPEQFCSTLKRVGFELVYESSFGADIVTKVYLDYLKDTIQNKGRENTHVLTSPCPALMNYVEKHTPILLEEFAPILSPMAAEAVVVRYWNDDNLAVVGATPCIAKKSELLDVELGLYDEKLTFVELIKMIDSMDIKPNLLPESEFDGIQALYGAGFPISGGLMNTLQQYTQDSDYNLIGSDFLILEGEDRSINYLSKMAAKKQQDDNLTGYPLLTDILYCEGCIMGKALGVDGDLIENRRLVAEYTQRRIKKLSDKDQTKEYQGYAFLVKNTAQAPEFEHWLKIVDQLIKEHKFTRTWSNKHYVKKFPSTEQMEELLAFDGKHVPEDELNCGACGYDSCRERAIAVFNGENEMGGCIVHIKYEAKINLEENKRLQELDRLKSDFLSTVSHELRTPLTSILGFSRIIRKRLQDKIFPLIPVTDKKTDKVKNQIMDNTDIIISESERLTSLINNLLDLSKMEAGKIEWKAEELSISEVVDRAIAATTSLFEQKGLTLIKDVESNLPNIIGDQDRLIQTVINLISNAIKFTDQGSITCRARRYYEDKIEVSIIDTGIGIDPENQDKVFEKFKQVGDTLTDKPKGTGLGLSICKQIVEQHGGRIWVESKVGKGSTFSFALPVI
jgi:signal transduction histidine kinase/Pyruvate/2-oxoacid:ferredoxin oxidoreductase delta subunit